MSKHNIHFGTDLNNPLINISNKHATATRNITVISKMLSLSFKVSKETLSYHLPNSNGSVGMSGNNCNTAVTNNVAAKAQYKITPTKEILFSSFLGRYAFVTHDVRSKST